MSFTVKTHQKCFNRSARKERKKIIQKIQSRTSSDNTFFMNDIHFIRLFYFLFHYLNANSCIVYGHTRCLFVIQNQHEINI